MATDGVAGRLVLVGTPIGNLGDLSPRAVETLRDADVIAAEDTRRARTLLSHAEIASGGRLRSVHGHNEARSAEEIVREVAAGKVVAYVSDAGMPGISDPGERLVAACVDAGLVVDVVPGPSAVSSALAVSGLPAGRYHFEGFLPRRGAERARRIAAVAGSDDTTLVFESAKRVEQTLVDLAAACGQDRPAAMVRELTKVHQQVRRGSLAALLEETARDPARGELVLVIGGAPEAEVDDAAIAAAAREAILQGATTRDAAGTVSARFGIGRSRAYDAALRAQSDSRLRDER